MGLQLVHGIIGRAHDLDPEFAQQALRGKGVLGELGIAVIVNFAGRRWVQPLVLDAEGTLQLHVRPVVQRIAQRIGHGVGPHLEFLPVGCITRAIPFRDAIRPHGSPLVMVAAQPDLGKTREFLVLGDRVGRQMAMVVNDGLQRRVFMVQTLGRAGFQQEIVIEEWLHGATKVQ